MKLIFTSLLLFGFLCISNAQNNVGIGTTNPNPSAILDLNSDSLGFLPPRLSTIQRDKIINPLEGAIIYNLDSKCLNLYKSNEWQSLCGCNSVGGLLTSSDDIVCLGSPSVLNLSAFKGGILTWMMSNDGVNFDTVKNELDPELAYRFFKDTYVKVLVKDGSCPSAASNTVRIDIQQDASEEVNINEPDPFCATIYNGIYTIDPIPGALSYNWRVNPGRTILYGQGSDSIVVDSIYHNDSVCVIVVYKCSAGKEICEKMIRHNLTPVQPMTGIFDKCADLQSVTYSVPPILFAKKYEWTFPAGITILGTDTSNSVLTNIDSIAQGDICVRAVGRCDTTAWLCKTLQQGSWKSVARLSAYGRRRAFSFTLNNLLFVGGGIAYQSTVPYVLEDMWAYDPVSNTWTQKANVPAGPIHSVVSLVANNKGYIFTGMTGLNESGPVINLSWEYNPATNTWSEKLTFPGSPRWEAMGFNINGLLYVGGGTDRNKAANFQDVFVYNPTTNLWNLAALLPVGLRSGASYSISGKGYFVTGNNSVKNYQYDPISNTWITVADFPTNWWQYSSSFVFKGFGYVLVGHNGSAQQRKGYRYNPILNTWKEIYVGNLGYHSGVTDVIGTKAYHGTGEDFRSNFWEYCPDVLPSIE
jgi:N-acetylneuraminic acid mutarotase